ncbi:hypothetical protein LTR05_008746 [Lithohypha guttulata]|uniref:Uncharacterized protein n=1 Tax=Lithohypha guttulata TaxID=1690604 RepID=A0AAN7QA94_9EURO|nr:hypothetical protein LTR05_008746 [Lithohypha guttulata]
MSEIAKNVGYLIQQRKKYDTTVPDLATVKDFLRFYIATSQPRLAAQTTTDSMGTVAEWFFAGFARITGTVVPAGLRSEVYAWQRRVLTAQGLLVNVRRPKHNFTVTDLSRIVVAAWTNDDLVFTPERYRIQFTFIIRVFCWTGARIGAFLTGGLRYEDIELKIIYKIDQRWVKNNRDPKNIIFGTALREHDKFIFDDVATLLPMVFADKALFGFDTLADLQEQQIPDGQDELILRWRESALHKPILRKCTQAGGLRDEPMPKAAFSQIFHGALLNAGYFCQASIHSIRRQLGKQVDELYTEVQRSQHLTQADPRIFGQVYVANTSSVDGQGAFLGEPVNHKHIDFFQGLGRFLEPGLPSKLPARLEEGLKQDPEYRKLEADVRQCPQECPVALKQSKQLLASCWSKLKRVALINTRRSGYKIGETGTSLLVERSNAMISIGLT